MYIQNGAIVFCGKTNSIRVLFVMFVSFISPASRCFGVVAKAVK